MGRRFGTIPGWAYAPDYNAKTNRVYKGTPSLIVEAPEKDIPKNKTHKYKVVFDIKLYFYDSPPDVPVVTRIIENQIIIQILDHEYPGGLDAWVHYVTTAYAKEVWDDSQRELSGLTDSGGDDYIIDIIEKEYTPPEKEIPDYILSRIDKIRDYIEEAESYDEKKALQDEAVTLLRYYMSEDEARKFVPIR